MRRWLRRLFLPAPLPAIYDYMDANEAVRSILAFVKKGQPGGAKHEVWLIWNRDGACLAAPGRTGLSSSDAKTVHFREEDILQLLQRCGFWNMRDEIGTARDGVHYAVVFVNRQVGRLVRIWNPMPDSPCAQLVQDILGSLKSIWDV